MKTFRRLALAFAIACPWALSYCSCALADDAPAPQFPLVSFADLYRLTVNAAPEALVFAPVPANPQVRVSMTETFDVAEPRFTISQTQATRGWMLLLAGLAAASWVAHRRLTSAY